MYLVYTVAPYHYTDPFPVHQSIPPLFTGAVVAYGSVITLKNHRGGGGLLHSHSHLFPEEVSKFKQQQVCVYMHVVDILTMMCQLCKSLSVVCLSVYLFCLSVVCLSVCLSFLSLIVCLSVCLSSCSLFVCLSVRIYMYCMYYKVRNFLAQTI